MKAIQQVLEMFYHALNRDPCITHNAFLYYVVKERWARSIGLCLFVHGASLTSAQEVQDEGLSQHHLSSPQHAAPATVRGQGRTR